MSVVPRGRIVWRALPGCRGVTAPGPEDAAGPSGVWDTLVFDSELAASAAREKLVTTGFAATAPQLLGPVQETAAGSGQWTCVVSGDRRTTVPPHMCDVSWTEQASEEQYVIAVGVDGLEAADVPAWSSFVGFV